MGWVSTVPVRSRKRLYRCYLLTLLQTSLPSLKVVQGKQLPLCWLCSLVSILLKDILRFGQLSTLTSLSTLLSFISPSPLIPPLYPFTLSSLFSPFPLTNFYAHTFRCCVSPRPLTLPSRLVMSWSRCPGSLQRSAWPMPSGGREVWLYWPRPFCSS